MRHDLMYNNWYCGMLTSEAKAQEVTKTISNKLDKIHNKEEILANLNYEKDLIEQDIVRDIKDSLCYSMLNLFSIPANKFLYNAWWWNMHKNDADLHSNKDVDKEKLKEYQQAFNYVLFYIEDELLNKDKNFEFVDMIMSNNGEFYDFKYKYNTIMLSITVPNFELADVYNYRGYLYEPYAIYFYKTECYLDLVCQEKNWKDIYPKLIEWLKEQGVYKDVKKKKSK